MTKTKNDSLIYDRKASKMGLTIIRKINSKYELFCNMSMGTLNSFTIEKLNNINNRNINIISS